MRESTKETVAVVIRNLRAGKSPKEIARRLGLTHSAVKMILLRYQDARAVYIQTYPLRYPHNKECPPEKFSQPVLREIVT